MKIKNNYLYGIAIVEREIRIFFVNIYIKYQINLSRKNTITETNLSHFVNVTLRCIYIYMIHGK